MVLLTRTTNRLFFSCFVLNRVYPEENHFSCMSQAPDMYNAPCGNEAWETLTPLVAPLRPENTGAFVQPHPGEDHFTRAALIVLLSTKRVKAEDTNAHP